MYVCDGDLIYVSVCLCMFLSVCLSICMSVCAYACICVYGVDMGAHLCASLCMHVQRPEAKLSFLLASFLYLRG